MNQFNVERLQSVLNFFSVPKKKYRFKPITNGLINDTFFVLEGDKTLYILQKINNSVFNDIEGMMSNMQNALVHLKDQDYKALELIPTLDKKSYHFQNGFWRLTSYIEQSVTYNTTSRVDVAFEAGKIIGKFHSLLAKVDMEKYVDTIPHFHDLEFREEQFKKSILGAKKRKLQTAKTAIAFVNETFEYIGLAKTEEQPLRICHNDTKLNNILFSKVDDTALCLIDLDTLMKGCFYYDFGDAVRTIVNTAPEDETDHSKIIFETALFEAFLKGLSENASFLTKNEIASMPFGVIVMPFLHGLRALTDYLNENIYYKVSYDNQNLDRALSLFDFTKKAIANTKYMKATITRTFI
ncbi:phosphotransferase enzyme family protein [Costertonia aggregata]|uniref:Aminoglycoside phosphotransferase family protein n=1 Tax=Costertonia aggregata TaxID=343403 RepID=A0A7H9AMK9_9FLAO|nr:aminoglycoside phosphotransferase family protein [Costertonia aggregata]QLG44681.1 aminoglycoside phosphotransferase family protein [Costertonia aggregata]